MLSGRGELFPASNARIYTEQALFRAWGQVAEEGGDRTTPMKYVVPAGSPQSRVLIALAINYTDNAVR